MNAVTSHQINILPQRKTTHFNPIGGTTSAHAIGASIVTGSTLYPLAAAATYLSEKFKIIPPTLSYKELFKQKMLQNEKLGHIFSAKIICKAACPLLEFLKQINRKLNPPHTTVSNLKLSELLNLGICIPIQEEILFRYLLQDVILTQLPKQFLSSNRQKALDSTTAKVTRILITSTLFSLYHLNNLGKLPDSVLSEQLVRTFILGIGCGILKESDAGLIGAISAHAANNILSLVPFLLKC
jgi:hypothetical protein